MVIKTRPDQPGTGLAFCPKEPQNNYMNYLVSIIMLLLLMNIIVLLDFNVIIFDLTLCIILNVSVIKFWHL